MRILILDDDPSRRSELAALAGRACPHAELCRASSAALAAGEPSPAIVLLRLRGGDPSPGCATIADLRTRWPEARLLVVGAQDAAAPAVAALQAGASHYLVLRDGGDPRELLDAMSRVARPARRASTAGERGATESLTGLIGSSAAMQQVRELVRMAARTDAHVLIEGETGTGKEVVARAVHALGRRAAGPFVPVNCAAVPESLAESEFFGHARGAFTGALQERPGVLQLADRGTLFLDEVEDLSPALQAKLLRVVQDREVRPLGATTLRRVDVRLVAASNRELWRMVEAGEFRRDLYYRLRVFSIVLPPLRARREDLRALIAHFVTRFNQVHAADFRVPSEAALRPLLEHSWPGNVRELENTLESLFILASASGSDLSDVLARPRTQGAGLVGDERARILRVLDDHRWNRQRAAAALGISRVTLWRRMERHGIRDPLGAPVRETA
jgi:two-component system NtrC family response regulator